MCVRTAHKGGSGLGRLDETARERGMHIRRVSRVRPMAAYNIEAILDIILQFINVIEAIERLLGVDVTNKASENPV